MAKRSILQIAIAFLVSLEVGQAYALEVESICNKTHLNTVNLIYRDRDANIKIIREQNLGTSEEAKFLKKYYSILNQNGNETLLSKKSHEGNLKYIPNSELKNLFLKYSTQEQKLSNPTDYRSVILSTIDQFIPKELNKVNWFLNLTSHQISQTNIRPGRKEDFGDIYGAVTRFNKENSGKFNIEIIFSNNESEPIPYLIPLIIHETEHTVEFEKKILLEKTPDKLQEYITIEEAKGFNSQMTAYVSLINKHPEIFCNWLYGSWSYGEILVPLGWTMASMEKDLKDGVFLYRYTKEGVFKNNKKLFNSAGTDLNSDIKREIKALKLRYVK